jgi:hypothetical protein
MYLPRGAYNRKEQYAMHDRRLTASEVYVFGLTAGYDLRTSWTYGWRRWPALSDRLQKAFRDGWLDGRDNGLRDKRAAR